ncbi:MAG: sigma-70 family RNA polymerase sigma factor [Bacilli bacterium]|nr:sigma-70 family RNA polymerase sigma factor [Bacilli bacterium]
MLKLNDEIISDYEKLVYSIVNKYSNQSNKEDLFQAGMIGIINASKKYDSNTGIKFTSFAYKYILGEILKYLREDRNIRISRDIIRDHRKVMIIKDKIYKSYGRPATIEEISKILKISKERICDVLNYSEKEISLYKTVGENEEITIEDTIYKEENLEREDLINLKEALLELTLDEKKLIYDRYFQNKTQTEIAKEKNIPQVKVYRYERKVLDKLKDKMS